MRITRNINDYLVGKGLMKSSLVWICPVFRFLFLLGLLICLDLLSSRFWLACFLNRRCCFFIWDLVRLLPAPFWLTFDFWQLLLRRDPAGSAIELKPQSPLSLKKLETLDPSLNSSSLSTKLILFFTSPAFSFFRSKFSESSRWNFSSKVSNSFFTVSRLFLYVYRALSLS